MNNTILFPPLPLSDWEDTKRTLHLFVQIVGKIRLKTMPERNHWWHVPLYVNTQGIGTGPIPYQGNRFEINFDFVNHQLRVKSSNKPEKKFELYDGISVSNFYKSLFDILNELDIHVEILAKPYDNESTIPFEEDTVNKSYDREYIERFWQILLQVDRIFHQFSSQFYGKCCPVHLYWHSLDLAITRFSGRKAPEMPQSNRVNKEAYSHEVISFGFWPGDKNIRNPAFYSYTYPAPRGLDKMPLAPDSAKWIEMNESPMALLMYDDIRNEDRPDQKILHFLESAYQAGAKKAGWEITELKR